jgi:glycosyltransferase involved in cell wall biosynthesis
MKLNNKFVILTSFYNAEDYLAQSAQHSILQGYDDLGIIFINDGSTDYSKDVLFAEITGNLGGNISQSGSSLVWTGLANGKNIIYTENTTNVGCAALNQKIAVDTYINNTGTICGIVDGDDWLNDGDAVSFVVDNMSASYDIYQSTHYKNMESIPTPYKLSNHPLTGINITGKDEPITIREQGWHCEHFRAFRKYLSDAIDTGRSFIDPTGGLIKPASDVAYFIPMMEMATPTRILTTQVNHYPISGVDFATGSGAAFLGKYTCEEDYFSESAGNFSGMSGDQSGFYIWHKAGYDIGSTGCWTPYDPLN